ncbi:AAA family ATPase [Actinoplanes sp. CA-131856]
MLLGRAPEQAALTGLLETARGGGSAVLVVSGAAGVGKSALLAELAEAAPDLRIAPVAGVESEMELPFAALHQLCRPRLDLLGALPEPQRAALEVAFGLADGAAPDPFLVGRAALTLLSEAAREQPLVCVVDDAQWLDAASARTLGFVARRLGAESLVMIFAVRTVTAELRGLPVLTVAPLGRDDAGRLLDGA